MIKRGALVVGVLLLAAALHYFLPQVDVVRIVGTEIKRVDVENSTSGNQVTRDVYRIQTETLDGAPSVYRNEDVLLLGKVDSAELQAKMQSLSADKSVAAIRHYGWRIPLFSMFPNALNAWPVDEDYRHFPVFNVLFFAALIGGAAWMVLKIRKAKAARARAREEARARAEAAEADAQAKRIAKEKEGRADIDAFLNDDD